MREPDAGVARRAFDHGAAGLQLRRVFSAASTMRARRAILHRAAGIHELGLAENLAAGLLAHAR